MLTSCRGGPPTDQEELEQLRQNLARLSEPGLENAYREAYKDCELKGNRLPRPVAISAARASVETAVEVAPLK